MTEITKYKIKNKCVYLKCNENSEMLILKHNKCIGEFCKEHIKEILNNEFQIEKNHLYKYWISDSGIDISHYYTSEERKKKYNERLKNLEDDYIDLMNE